jgi:hypothetical protein
MLSQQKKFSNFIYNTVYEYNIFSPSVKRPLYAQHFCVRMAIKPKMLLSKVHLQGLNQTALYSTLGTFLLKFAPLLFIFTC